MVLASAADPPAQGLGADGSSSRPQGAAAGGAAAGAYKGHGREGEGGAWESEGDDESDGCEEEEQEGGEVHQSAEEARDRLGRLGLTAAASGTLVGQLVTIFWAVAPLWAALHVSFSPPKQLLGSFPLLRPGQLLSAASAWQASFLGFGFEQWPGLRLYLVMALAFCCTVLSAVHTGPWPRFPPVSLS